MIKYCSYVGVAPDGTSLDGIQRVGRTAVGSQHDVVDATSRFEFDNGVASRPALLEIGCWWWE